MKHLLITLLAVSLVFFALSCSKDKDKNPTGPTEQPDLIGTWLSTGANVAPLLVQLMAIDSLWAEFKTDNTYLVKAKSTTGTVTQFTGTYTHEKSTVGTIYKIKLNQTTPTVLTSEGIYQIDKTKTPNEMMYEVVQTEPNIGATPPTPEGGFGSTNGGALGTWNVQKYIRLK
ncbi:MAG: hypothetical protein ONB16_09960 [candidate division KSB1 bacterium]|nr:hypothetical protein [candidate division KSB1 bacterium]MDZ7317806.1 hypothetical protein [candidate division KSB1 bacterium]MDZ7341630.1 hypothetical protein [candidate division KSB1 bacterium]